MSYGIVEGFPSAMFSKARLDTLSDAIFGVAMTLLAYDLPKASQFANAPAWIDLVRAYAQPVIALIISAMTGWA